MALFIGYDLSFLCPLLSSPRETQTTSGDHFRQVLRVHEYLWVSLGHYRPGEGVLSVLFLQKQEDAKGKGEERVSKDEREEDMLFTGMDKDSRSSSSTRVTLQPLDGDWIQS